MKKYLFSAILMYSLISSAGPGHDHANKNEWDIVMLLLGDKKIDINECEEETGETLLDIAFRRGAEPWLIDSLQALGAEFCMPHGNLDTPYIAGDPCVNFLEELEACEEQPIARMLSFEDSLH